MAKQRGQYHRLIKSLIQSEKNDLLQSLLKGLSPFDIAAAMLQLKTKYQVQILASLPEDRASEVLAEMSSTLLPLTDLVAELPLEQLGGWLAKCQRMTLQILLDYGCPTSRRSASITSRSP